jgi:hypothetical protein
MDSDNETDDDESLPKILNTIYDYIKPSYGYNYDYIESSYDYIKPGCYYIKPHYN